MVAEVDYFANGGIKCYSEVVGTGTATTTGNLSAIDLGFTPAFVMFQFMNANGTNKTFSVYNKYYDTAYTVRYSKTGTSKEQIANPQTNPSTPYVGIWSVSGSEVTLNVQSGMADMYLYAIEDA
jgi:hypothetical protein